MKNATISEAMNAAFGAQPTGERALSGSPFESANWSTQRQQIWWSNLDTEKEVDTSSRLELMRLSRWCVDNLAPYRNVVENLPTLVTGAVGLQPFATTADKDWNRLAMASFRRHAATAQAFDLGGQWNFATSQNAALSHQLRDGDMLGVFTEAPHGAAMMHFYEAHQCGTPRNIGGGWYDGIKCDQHGKPLAFRVAGGAMTMDLPAENVVHFVDDRRRGARRGLPCGFHWFNDGRDWSEYKLWAKQAVKNSAMIAYFRRRQSSGSNTEFEMGSTLDIGDATTPDVIKVRDISEMNSQALELGDDTLEILHDDRPHPNVLEFQRSLIVDLAVGIGVPPALVFWMSGLGGTEVRLVLQSMKGWIARKQQQLVDTYVSRFWIYSTARDMQRGILPACSDAEWWKHGVICPADMTVDIGREGNMKIALANNRMLTLAAWAGEQGAWWEEYQDTILRENARGARRLREISAEEDVTVAETVAYMKNFGPATLAAEPGDMNDDPDDNPTGDPDNAPD